MTTSITLPAPAKLNLFLHILGQRPDGYHTLQTLFQLLDYGDELTFSLRQDGVITLVSPALPDVPTEENLIYRAAVRLQQHSGVAYGADIVLNKMLPIGGGIGGGSSDAATTLLGLNHLWQCALDLETLGSIGQTLGADVPVFVAGRTTWAEGIGEQLTPIDQPEHYYVVIAPHCHISTAQVFSHKQLTRHTPAITVAAFLEKGGKNDCQPLVEQLYPQVKDAVDWLDQYGPAQLTGTGACVFAPFTSGDIARAVLAKRPRYLSGFVAKGVNLSPLHQCLT